MPLWLDIGPSDMQRLLDWGCGCGRLTAHWLHQGRIPEIHGCDINPDGIAWCRSHLRNGHFAVVKFDPPTPYTNDYFDGIAAFSVFTHLTQPAQQQWLAEMHRILRPGGVFVATVHGRSAGWFRFGPAIDELLSTGIHDGTISHGIEEIVGAWRIETLIRLNRTRRTLLAVGLTFWSTSNGRWQQSRFGRLAEISMTTRAFNPRAA